MPQYVVFYEDQPVRIKCEVYQNALKIGNSLIYYPELEKRVIGEVILINFLNGQIPTAKLWVGDRKWNSDQTLADLHQINCELAEIKEKIKRGEPIDDLAMVQYLNTLLEPECEEYEVNSTTVDKFLIPISIEGHPAQAFIDTGARINVVRVLPKKARNSGKSVSIQTVNHSTVSSVYRFEITIQGKTKLIDAIVGSVPADLLLSSDTAEEFGLSVKIG